MRGRRRPFRHSRWLPPREPTYDDKLAVAHILRRAGVDAWTAGREPEKNFMGQAAEREYKKLWRDRQAPVDVRIVALLGLTWATLSLNRPGDAARMAKGLQRLARRYGFADVPELAEVAAAITAAGEPKAAVAPGLELQ